MHLLQEFSPEEFSDLRQAVIDFAYPTASFITSNWKAIHDFLDKQAERHDSDVAENTDETTKAMTGTSFMSASMRSYSEQLNTRKST